MKRAAVIVAALALAMGTAGAAAPESPLSAVWAACGVGGSGAATFVGLAADRDGNLYASGYLLGEVAFGKNVTAKAGRLTFAALLVKFDPSGKALWARTVTGTSGYSVFSGVAVDAAGNVYAAGGIGYGKYDLDATIHAIGVYTSKDSSEINMILAKYDANGKPIWARTPPRRQGGSVFNAVRVDSAGGIYAAGWITLDAAASVELSNKAPSFKAFPQMLQEYRSALMVKYDSSGRALWAVGVSGSEFQDIAIDGSDDVVAFGSGSGGPLELGSGARLDYTNRFVIAKYDSSGRAQWARSLLAYSGEFQARKICVDGSGGVYLAAELSYSPMSLDASLYAAFGNGVVMREKSTAGVSMLVKYDTAGVPRWAVKVAEHPSEIRAIAADGRSVFVSGGKKGGPDEQCMDFGNGVAGRTQATWGTANFIVAYDLSGAARWSLAPPVQGESKAVFDLLLPDGTGSLYAGGSLKGQQTADFGAGVTLRSTSTTENVLAVRYMLRVMAAPPAAQAGPPAAAPCSPSPPSTKAVALFDPTLGLTGLAPVISGAEDSPLMAKWAKNGGRDGEGLQRVFGTAAADPAGNVYAAGATIEGIPCDLGDGVSVSQSSLAGALLARYSASGKTLWARTPSRSTTASMFSSVAVDAGGNIFAMGTMGQGSIAFTRTMKVDAPKAGRPILVKFDSSGTPQWIHAFDPKPDASWYTAVAVNKEGAVYVAASDFVAKLDASGKALWNVPIQPGNRGQGLYFSIVVDDEGNAYALGWLSPQDTFTFGNEISLVNKGSYGNTFVVKYDASGVAQWVTGIQTEWDGIRFLGLGGSGSLFAAGSVKGMYDHNFGNGVTIPGQEISNARQMIVLVKFDSSGAAQWERHLESGSGLFDFRAAAISDRRIYIAATVFPRESTPGYAKGEASIDFLAAYDLSGELRWIVMPPWDLGKAAIGSLSATTNGGLVMTAHTGNWGGLDLGSGVTVEGGSASAVMEYRVSEVDPTRQ